MVLSPTMFNLNKFTIIQYNIRAAATTTCIYRCEIDDRTFIICSRNLIFNFINLNGPLRTAPVTVYFSCCILLIYIMYLHINILYSIFVLLSKSFFFLFNIFTFIRDKYIIFMCYGRWRQIFGNT